MNQMEDMFQLGLNKMPANYYFNNFKASNEQEMLDDLTVESINIHGEEVWYLPRTLEHFDPLFGQSDIVSYKSAYLVPMYIGEGDVDGFGGQGNFMARFGLEIRDQVTFTVATKTFQDEVADNEPVIPLSRPREGDLIYFPLNHKLFQILFVDKFQMFYPLGSLHSYRLVTELFEYSAEKFSTGIAEIDSLEVHHSLDLVKWALHDELGDYFMTEDGDIWVDETYGRTEPTGGIGDSNTLIGEANTFVDFSQNDPTGIIP